MSAEAMAEMAEAIRNVMLSYGSNLREISERELRDFAVITGAFSADFYREVERRERAC